MTYSDNVMYTVEQILPDEEAVSWVLTSGDENQTASFGYCLHWHEAIEKITTLLKVLDDTDATK